MKTMSRRDIDRLMRYLIDFAYADVPGNKKYLFTNSPDLNKALESLGLSDRKDQALHVLAGYGLIEFQELPKRARTNIILTNKGKAYFEMRRDARISLLCKSILLPILISLITTMIAVYILPAIGQQVQRWMQESP